MKWLRQSAEECHKKAVHDAWASLRSQLKWAQRGSDTMQYIPSQLVIPDQAEISTAFGDVRVSIPRSNTAIQDIRGQLQAWEVEFTEEDDSSCSGSYVIRVPIRGLDYLIFVFKPGMEGSTCQLKKIGETDRVYKMPVYEVVCNEGAAEDW
jgi:hypothetical protein